MPETKTLILTDSEAKTLLFYIEKDLIDAEGMLAIGVGSNTTIKNLKNIKAQLESA